MLAAEIFLVFALVWWMIFFIVLPVYFVKSTHVLPGHADSAPEKTNLRRVIKITTWISFFVTGGYAAFLLS